jgi:integrase
MPDKRRLQISELNDLFAHPWFTGCASPNERYKAGSYRLSGSEFWVPIVALYTGCRAAELGGMKVADVRLEDSHPHLIVRDNEYRRTKAQRTRRVPILDALITLGFPAYLNRIREAGHDRLFPDWTARLRKGAGPGDDPAWSNSGIIRAFNRKVIPAALGDRLPQGARREVTFHSLRGAFKAMLAAGNNIHPVLVNAVVGHKNEEMDGRYIGEATIEETYPVVHAANFNGLLLPKAP